MQLDSRQIRIILIVFAAVVGVLAILWLTLLRTPMVPAYQNIREADASAIVGALDQAGIPYQLTNNGHDILVPEDQAAEARVVVAGSNVSFGGTVGFELFNDSDMGLTEFAQKINYQRAMQGELSRTIMMMDGVDFARVHLAIPERSVFRAEQGEPTAAVTVEMLPGAKLTRQRIEGIRQLIASSVQGLPTYSVAVLDENGDLVSAPADAQTQLAAPTSERGALENFYIVRGRKAIESVLPGMPFELEVAARARNIVDEAVQENDREPDTREDPERADMAFRVLVRTPHTLGPEERDVIESALVDTLDLAEGDGDVLTFSTGALTQRATASDPVTTSEPAAEMPDEIDGTQWNLEDGLIDILFSRWVLIALALLAIVLLVMRPRRVLADDEAAGFAELLKSASAERGQTFNG